ncbi:hypothetical protein CYMTET_11751 [Cymbomonas tetramitiformis]|uniref:GMP phosphodiesterase delta subunit domain-containing protein n=1 Tax=Cymbomonas tetramitiformis TaxID=36881 RepID=A0AAE0GLE0_9CHLO|nr:hypothetical protein CYMTET_11751 [Cymbomonas tetramitiformis]
MAAEIEGPTDELAMKINEGFRINWMNMRDARVGKVLWEQQWPEDWKTQETVASIPKEVMKCREVSRELNFSSAEPIDKFTMIQRVFVHEVCTEEWNFDFGFVIPGSTNSWQSTIEAADEQDMLEPEMLSGNVLIETSFLNGDTLINKSVVRIFYV